MFKKGDKKPEGSGIKKGTQRKETQQLKEMILEALDMAGGKEYLYEQAMANPNAFMQLIAKVIPKDVNATITGSVTHEVIDGSKQWLDNLIIQKNAASSEQKPVH